MADKEAAERAFANPNPVIEGRRANVNLAYLGAKPKMSGPGNCALYRRMQRGIVLHGEYYYNYKALRQLILHVARYLDVISLNALAIVSTNCIATQEAVCIEHANSSVHTRGIKTQLHIRE